MNLLKFFLQLGDRFVANLCGEIQVAFALGLFLIVINAILLKLTGELVNGFEVEDFWSAIWGALVISIVTLIANSLSGKGNPKVHFKRAQPRERPPNKRGYARDDDDGPVIDV